MVRREQLTGTVTANEGMKRSSERDTEVAPAGAALDLPPVAHAAPENSVSLVVLIPAHNEADRIVETLAALRGVEDACKQQNIALSLYVVNDGSKDATGELAQRAGANRVVHHKLNRGLGAAVRSGLIAARTDSADIVVKFDADLQHDPNDILRLVRPILDDEADLVYGNRFPGIQYKMPFVRRIGNAMFTRLMAWLTGWPLKDSQPGIFAVNQAFLANFYLPGDYNYTQQVLLDGYHRGMRFAHVPVTFRPRTSGKSFVSYRYPLKVLPQLLMVLIGVKPMRVFGPIGLTFLLLAGAILVLEMGMWLSGDSPKPVVHVNALLGCLTLGLHALFFGALADLIVRLNRK